MLRIIGFFLCFAMFLCGPVAAQIGVAPAGTLISSKAVAFNSVTGKTYVVDAVNNAIWVLDASAGSKVKVDAGSGASAVVVNRKTGRAYASMPRDGTVVILDGGTDSIVARLKAGPHPYTLAVDEVRNLVYVTNTFSDVVAVISGTTNSVQMLRLGSADGVAVDEKTGRVFLISYEDPNLKILDGATHALAKVPVGEHLWGMAVSELTGTIYLTRTGASELVAVDERTHEKQVVNVGRIPCAVAVDDKAGRVFVMNYSDGSITTLTAPGLKVVATVAVGVRPQSLAVSAGRHSVYVASLHGDILTAIDESTGKAIGTWPAGPSPYGLGLSSRADVFYVANLGTPAWTAVHVR